MSKARVVKWAENQSSILTMIFFGIFPWNFFFEDYIEALDSRVLNHVKKNWKIRQNQPFFKRMLNQLFGRFFYHVIQYPKNSPKKVSSQKYFFALRVNIPLLLVAKLRPHFQNQIAIAKNCDFLMLNLKITQKTEFCNEWIW